jgi:hypothetical protein
MKLNSILKLSSLAIVSLGLVSTVALTTTSCGEKTDGERSYNSVDEYLRSHALNNFAKTNSQFLRDATSNPYDFSNLAPSATPIVDFIANNLTNQLVFNSVIFTATYSARQSDSLVKITENKITDKLVDVNVSYEDFEDSSILIRTHVVYKLTSAGVVGHFLDLVTNEEHDIVFAVTDKKLSTKDDDNKPLLSTPVRGYTVAGNYEDPLFSGLSYDDASFKTVAVADGVNYYDMTFPISMYD